jgi:hypothetical protein
MMRHPIRIFVAAILLCGVAWLVWLLMPKALDMDILHSGTTHSFQVGRHDVRIVLSSLVEGDNGSALVQVYNGNTLLETRMSTFSFDTLQSTPPAHVRYAWVDGDLIPDLLVELQNESFYISSQSGTLVAL